MQISRLESERTYYRNEFADSFGQGVEGSMNWGIDDADLAMRIVRGYADERGMFKDLDSIEQDLYRHRLISVGPFSAYSQTLTLMRDYHLNKPEWDQVLGPDGPRVPSRK